MAARACALALELGVLVPELEPFRDERWAVLHVCEGLAKDEEAHGRRHELLVRDDEVPIERAPNAPDANVQAAQPSSPEASA